MGNNDKAFYKESDGFSDSLISKRDAERWGGGGRKPKRLPLGGGLRLRDDVQLVDNLRFTADDFGGIVLNVLLRIRRYAVSCNF